MPGRRSNGQQTRLQWHHFLLPEPRPRAGGCVLKSKERVPAARSCPLETRLHRPAQPKLDLGLTCARRIRDCPGAPSAVPCPRLLFWDKSLTFPRLRESRNGGPPPSALCPRAWPRAPFGALLAVGH